VGADFQPGSQSGLAGLFQRGPQGLGIHVERFHLGVVLLAAFVRQSAFSFSLVSTTCLLQRIPSGIVSPPIVSAKSEMASCGPCLRSRAIAILGAAPLRLWFQSPCDLDLNHNLSFRKDT
jgi:hypothetical protein